MSSSDELNSDNLKTRITGASGSSPNDFCPMKGMQGKTSVNFLLENNRLLQQRLMMAALILFGGFSAFLAREILLKIRFDSHNHDLFLPHIVATIILGLFAGTLYYFKSLDALKLRLLEYGIFGVTSFYFVFMYYNSACDCTIQASDFGKSPHAFPSQAVLPWMILMSVYSAFIPNTCKRSMWVITMFFLLPLLTAAMAARQQPDIATVLYSGGLSTMVIWLSISASISIFGIHRLGALRREAYDAKKLGAYTLKHKIGAGGMGDVFLAEHQLLKRPCAIKLIKPEKAGDVQALSRFEVEVQATAHLTHPNTIEIYDYGNTEDQTFYYVMEFLPGMNLFDLVEHFGPLSPDRTIYLLKQACDALHEAHHAGLIHRDIKPGNIFSSERGGRFDFVKLLDFGLVKSTLSEEKSSRITHEGTIVGSPLFAAPESSLEGNADVRSDIYSLGVTAYYMLTGKPIFDEDNPLKVIFAHANKTPIIEDSKNISPRMKEIILKCLQKNPDERFQTVDEFKMALTSCESGNPWNEEKAKLWWEDKINITSVNLEGTQDHSNMETQIVKAAD